MNTFAPEGLERMTVEEEQAVINAAAVTSAVIDRMDLVRIREA
jgi:hypothetical protein